MKDLDFCGLVILGEDPFALKIQKLRDSPTENDKKESLNKTFL